MIEKNDLWESFSSDKYFFLICLAIGTALWSLKGGALLYPIDASISLYLSSLFDYQYSLVLDWARNSWSIVHQIGSILINVGISYEYITSIFSFLSSVSLFLGVGLILRSLRVNLILLFPLAILISLFKTLPSLSGDYLFEGIGTKHLSHFSLALILLSFGLALARKQFSSAFIGALTVSVHPFFGAFFIPFILIMNMQLNWNNKQDILKILTGGALGFFISLCSFFLFMFSRIHSADVHVDEEAINSYLKYWDAHRNASISYKAILLSLLFPLLFIFLSSRQKSLQNEGRIAIRLFSYVIIISTILSLIPLFFNGPISKVLELITPGRFMTLNGLFIFFSISYFLCTYFSLSKLGSTSTKQLLFFNLIFLAFIAFNNDYLPFLHEQTSRNLITLFLVLLFPSCICALQYYVNKYKCHAGVSLMKKNIAIFMVMFIFSIFSFNLLIINPLTCNLDKTIKQPVLIASRNELYMLRSCIFPIVLDTENLDVIPYLPHKSDELEKIISIGYGINYFDPPSKLRFTAKLNDNKTFIYRKIWEDRSSKDWSKVKAELNISLIATPPDWNLNLNKIVDYPNISIYEIGN